MSTRNTPELDDSEAVVHDGCSAKRTPEPMPARYAPTGDVSVSPWAAGVVGDISDTETATRKPENRRVAVNESWLTYHNPSKLGSLHDMILTTEAIAREYNAVPCSKCYGGGTQYDYSYVKNGSVLP